MEEIGVADADKFFVESLLPIVQKHSKGFGQCDTLFEGPHVEAPLLRIAHRMASLVMAYAFDLEKEAVEADADEEGFLSDDEESMPKGMVPLADVLNADAENKNNVSCRPTEARRRELMMTEARLEHVVTSLTMVALKPIRKGEEIFNCRGQICLEDMGTPRITIRYMMLWNLGPIRLLNLLWSTASCKWPKRKQE